MRSFTIAVAGLLLWGTFFVTSAQATLNAPVSLEETYEVFISFSDFSLHLYDPAGNELFTALVALPRKTPKLPVEGQLTEIQRNPWWFPPPGVKAYVLKHEGKRLPDKVPPGPCNPMGPVKFIFMFSTPGAEPLSRAHGTTHPESIGKRASSGCIRMLNTDALALADIVQPLLAQGVTIKVYYVRDLEDETEYAEQLVRR